MSKKFEEFNCELNALLACVLCEGTKGCWFYSLNDEIFEWLHDNEIEHGYHKTLIMPIPKKPVIIFYDYEDLIAFKMMFSEAIQ